MVYFFPSVRRAQMIKMVREKKKNESIIGLKKMKGSKPSVYYYLKELLAGF